MRSGEKRGEGNRTFGQQVGSVQEGGIWEFVTSWAALCNKAQANNDSNYQALSVTVIVPIALSFKVGFVIEPHLKDDETEEQRG